MQNKRTPKKKSARNSQTSPTDERLPIFNLNGMNLIGRIVKDDVHRYTLEWAGRISYSFTSEKDKEGNDIKDTMEIRATIDPIIPQTRNYILPDAAHRGLSYHEDPWLKELYAKYVEHCEKGEYVLVNPFVKGVVAKLQMGGGNAESPDVSTGVKLSEVMPKADVKAEEAAAPAAPTKPDAG